MPKLNSVTLSIVRDLTNDKFFAFLRCNLQLKHLTVCLDECSTPSIWEDFADRMPNIISLNIYSGLTGKGIINFSALQHLKMLGFSYEGDHERSLVCSLLNDLIKNGQSIVGWRSIQINNELKEALKKLKTIQKLDISIIDEKDLIDLAKNLPELKSLRFTSGSFYDFLRHVYSHSYLRVMLNVLQHATKLTELIYEVSGDMQDLTEDLYNSILALAKSNRVKVSIIYGAKRELLENGIFNSKNRWINFIRYRF